MDQQKFRSVAGSQAGVFTRGQAITAGAHSHEATRSIRDGRWIRVAGRAFVLDGVPVGLEQLAWAAVLSVPDGILWGPAALKLWRSDVPVELPRLVDVAVPCHRRPQFRIRPRAVEVPSGDRADWRGIPVQTLAAALVDALAVLNERAADSLFAWALTRNLVTPGEFSAHVARRSGSRNVRRLRRYEEMWRSGAASTAEVLFHLVMKRHAITGWETNVRLKLPNGVTVRPDVLFRGARVVVEIDGWTVHGSRTAFQLDRTRQNALVEAGYRVLRFTWEDLTQRPSYCAAQVRRVLSG
jgi:very-short-patch-repair endonuclease